MNILDRFMMGLGYGATALGFLAMVISVGGLLLGMAGVLINAVEGEDDDAE